MLTASYLKLDSNKKDDMESTFYWRGYVNQVLYAATFRMPVDDKFVESVADKMIRQKQFLDPVAIYYRAMTDALASGESIALNKDHDETDVRDYLTRLLRGLGERKPWLEPPFRQENDDMWPEVRQAPIIASIPLTGDQVEDRLDLVFDDVDDAEVIILRLRTGQVVALVNRFPFDQPRLDLQAHTDLKSTIADFRKLTKLKAKSR